ncbi:MAG: cytochrome c [Nitrospinota bacterium]
MTRTVLISIAFVLAVAGAGVILTSRPGSAAAAQAKSGMPPRAPAAKSPQPAAEKHPAIEKKAIPPASGKEIFSKKGCGGCHALTGPEKKIPVTERAKIKGPSLWYTGSKYRHGYLARWLAAPRAFRGVLFGTMKRGRTPHPALPAGEAKAVGVYLEGFRDAKMPKGTVPRWKKIPRRVLRKARILFQKKQPCYSCHQVKIRKTVYRRPIQLGAFSAPHLIDAGLRLRPDFIAAFLKNPARYNPNGRMPIYRDKAFTRLSEKDIIGLAAYISTFKEKP